MGALVIGAVALDLFPPLGVMEIAAAVMVLVTRRQAASLAAAIPTGLILSSAILVMATVSGPGNPIMWPLAIVSCLTAVALVRGGATGTSETERL